MTGIIVKSFELLQELLIIMCSFYINVTTQETHFHSDFKKHLEEIFFLHHHSSAFRSHPNTSTVMFSLQCWIVDAQIIKMFLTSDLETPSHLNSRGVETAPVFLKWSFHTKCII